MSVSSPLEPPARLELAEAGGDDDRAAAAALDRVLKGLRGRRAAGIATTTASTASGRSSSRGTHGSPWTSVRLGLTPQTLPSKLGRREVSEDAVAV